LDQAQYRELEAFSKFGSDLDAATKAVLDKGARNVEILKQAQYSPVAVEKQVAIIHLGTKGLLQQVPVDRIDEFEVTFLAKIEERIPEVLSNFRAGKYDKEDLAKIEDLAKELTPRFV
jgi:F-type H+-transporting ATPase subunit alpha